MGNSNPPDGTPPWGPWDLLATAFFAVAIVLLLLTMIATAPATGGYSTWTPKIPREFFRGFVTAGLIGSGGMFCICLGLLLVRLDYEAGKGTPTHVPGLIKLFLIGLAAVLLCLLLVLRFGFLLAFGEE